MSSLSGLWFLILYGTHENIPREYFCQNIDFHVILKMIEFNSFSDMFECMLLSVCSINDPLRTSGRPVVRRVYQRIILLITYRSDIIVPPDFISPKIKMNETYGTVRHRTMIVTFLLTYAQHYNCRTIPLTGIPVELYA